MFCTTRLINNIHEQIIYVVRHRFDAHFVKLGNVTSKPSKRLGTLLVSVDETQERGGSVEWQDYPQDSLVEVGGHQW